MARERGFILLPVLLTLTALAFLASRILDGGRTAAALAGEVRDRAIAEAAADGTIERTVFDLLRTDPRQRAAGLSYTIPVPGGTAAVRITDLAGRANPNVVSQTMLAALLRGVGASAETARTVAGAIVRTRSAGRTLTRLGTGSATDERDRPPQFAAIADLARVPGMTPDLLQALAPHLSVWWRGWPDPGLADPVVLQALRVADEEELAAGTQSDERVVWIEAGVMTPSGARAVRDAIVRLGLGLDGVSYHFLAWDPPPD